MTEFARGYVAETIEILGALDLDAVDRVATGLAAVRERGGRLFVLGVGGSAGHASHAVNDFRKICGVEAYAPTDNVSELTARINDEGWETSLLGLARGLAAVRRGRAARVLRRRRRRSNATSRRTSSGPSTWRARSARQVYGIVGRDGGYTAARRRRRSRSSRRCTPSASRPTPRDSARSCGTCSCRIRRSSARRRSGSTTTGRTDGRDVSDAVPARRGRRRRRVHRQPPGAARCSGAPASRASSSTTTSRRAGGGTSKPFAGDARLEVIEGEVRGPRCAHRAMAGATTVVHLASNPDIAKAMTDPTIDFDEGTFLTHCVVEAARRASVGLVLYASGSGVYGDLGEHRVRRAPRPARTGVDVRREQARGRGADRVVLPHVRHARPRLPLRQRRGPEPDPRRRLRLRPQVARRPDATRDPRRRIPEQVVRPRRRRAGGRAARR